MDRTFASQITGGDLVNGASKKRTFMIELFS